MALRKSPSPLIAAFDAALPEDDLVERRKMFGFPAAFVNGNLFCGLYQEDVIVRLPPDLKVVLGQQGGLPWSPTPGRVMREYMVLPREIRRAELERWLSQSFAFASSLPPKVGKARKIKRGA